MSVAPPISDRAGTRLRYARSLLFVPADRPDRFEKAQAAAADLTILDLEDAVAANRKEEARANVAAWLAAHHPALVRINARDTPWYYRDLELLQQPTLVGVMVPKADLLEDSLVRHCAELGKPIIPLIESAAGFQRAADLAQTLGVARLAFGHLDFQVDVGIRGDDDALLYFRSHLVLVSRLAKLAPPIDGVTADVADSRLLEDEGARATRLGFGGKLCIHPCQVEAVNRAFSPSPQELQWARAVVDAVGPTLDGVVAIDGKMVDRPVILKAQRILDIAKILQSA